MSELGNKVLFALSAQRACSYATFRRLFDGLYGQCRQVYDDGVPIFRIRRRSLQGLSTLGHLDHDAQSDTVYVGTAALVRLPFRGVAEYVLCGNRSARTVHALRSAMRPYRANADLRVVASTVSDLAPDTVLLSSDSAETASLIARNAGIEIADSPASWDLLDFSPTVSEFIGKLVWRTAPELPWQRLDFDTTTFSFRAPQLVDSGDLRLSRYNEGSSFRYKHYLWRHGMSAEVDVSWGKHAVCSERNRQAISYSAGAGDFSVPLGLNIPALYARALTLCSGFLPTVKEQEDLPLRCLVYRRVPPDIAAAVGAALQQDVAITSALSAC